VKALVQSLLLAAAIFSLVGCGCGRTGDDKVSDKVTAGVEDAASMAKRVDGDFDKLKPEEKEKVLKLANNDETQARAMFKMMAHPPGGHGPQKPGAGK